MEPPDNRDDHGSQVEAWEVLLVGQSSLVTAHVALGEDAVVALAALTGRRGGGRDFLVGTLPDHVRLQDTRPRVISHVAWFGDQMPEPVADRNVCEALAGWTRLQRWQWFMATGLAPSDVLPDIEAPDVLGGTVHLSRDWRAMVLRDGVAYVAMTPYVPFDRSGHQSFHSAARVYVRTIHLDAVLLGLLQHRALHELADRIAGLSSAGLDPGVVSAMEAALIDLRTGLWWSHLTTHGRQTSDVLQAFQQQHGLPALYQQIVADLADAGRLLQARQLTLREDQRLRDGSSTNGSGTGSSDSSAPWPTCCSR